MYASRTEVPTQSRLKVIHTVHCVDLPETIRNNLGTESSECWDIPLKTNLQSMLKKYTSYIGVHARDRLLEDTREVQFACLGVNIAQSRHTRKERMSVGKAT